MVTALHKLQQRTPQSVSLVPVEKRDGRRPLAFYDEDLFEFEITDSKNGLMQNGGTPYY